MIPTPNLLSKTAQFLFAFDKGGAVLVPYADQQTGFNYTDSSATPGAVFHNTPRGKVAIAAAGSTVVVTNPLCDSAAKQVYVQVLGADGTAFAARVTPAAGSFTITLNAAATGVVSILYTIVA